MHGCSIIKRSIHWHLVYKKPSLSFYWPGCPAVDRPQLIKLWTNGKVEKNIHQLSVTTNTPLTVAHFFFLLGLTVHTWVSTIREEKGKHGRKSTVSWENLGCYIFFKPPRKQGHKRNTTSILIPYILKKKKSKKVKGARKLGNSHVRGLRKANLCGNSPATRGMHQRRSRP